MYSAHKPLIIKRYKKCKETEVCTCVYQNKLDKACFQHDIAYKYKSKSS